MAQSPSPAAPTIATSPISPKFNKTIPSSLGFQRVLAFHQGSDQTPYVQPICRRTVTMGLTSAVLGLGFSQQSASAAARRPPPPPPVEKKDPNLSGIQVKVLASKKRKEAMKAEVAKLRERGKEIKEPSE
ncbi:Zinc transporter like [Quillaja saponaria]|uniref:Zinc transporter like n=1 Tax=Quillaja saponaria TaxID=32244 RepID=A0AAD7QFN6_QUISA|nr:Zinc transporter like [Quillaja saponaria]